MNVVEVARFFLLDESARASSLLNTLAPDSCARVSSTFGSG